MDTPRLTSTLKEIYNEKGRDFTFNCRGIAKKIGCNSHKIAYVMPFLEKQGAITKKACSKKGFVYKTCFRGNENTSHL